MKVAMRLFGVLLLGVMLGTSVGVVLTPAMAKPEKIPQCFEYELGSASSYTPLNPDNGNFKQENDFVGTITAYDSGGVLYIGISIWAKPYFAWGEHDKAKPPDGTVDPEDLRSDGISIRVFDETYDWWVHPVDITSAIQVPSYPDGIHSEPIVYLLSIIIPGTYTAGDIVTICVEDVHVSPKEFVPPFVVPELPIGTLMAVSALFLALGIWIKMKSQNTYPYTIAS
jgi:hypothetical protein